MNITSLEDATESVLLHLLTEDQDWDQLITNLEDLAKERKRQAGMESHHIEPLREETISLWPLEHLAIHICHAKLEPSDSYNAKVAAFVRPFPGGYRRLLTLPDPLLSKVLNLGQSRPSNQGAGKLQYIHAEKDNKGRSLAAIKAAKVSSLKRQVPVKVTNLITKEITIYSSVKEAAEGTGIRRQNLSSYLTGYVSYLPRLVQGRYSYEVVPEKK
jgi:hypothetical protein